MQRLVKYAKIILVAILCLSLSLLFVACTPDDGGSGGDNEFNLTYTAGVGGTISGKMSQTVAKGENGSTVTAIASSGYVFAEWSDGVTTTSRTDKNVQNNISVTAKFNVQSTNNGDTGSGEGNTNTTSGIELDLATAQTLYQFSQDNDQITITKYIGKLTQVDIPEKIDNKPIIAIEFNAFYNCYNLTKITIPNSVTTIGDSAFSDCISLGAVTFGENSQLTTIGDGAFNFCSNLTSITIPNSVTSIGSGAFSFCSSLTSISIPSGVASMSDTIFFGCYKLESVTFGANSQLASIGEDAFRFCYALTNIVIPSSVKSIGNSAFCDCRSLVKIIIPSDVESIGNNAFAGCSALTSIVIPSSVKSIGSFAFSDDMIYCEATSRPSGWQDIWCTYSSIYWYSENTPTTSGNYWHYVGGVPTKW